MSYSYCSGNFSTSRRCYRPYSSCGSSYPSNLIYKPRIEPTSCQRSCVVSSPGQTSCDSTLHSGCQETCIKPINSQESCVVSNPCQTHCYYPRSSTPCSPCKPSYAGSLGFGSSSCFSGSFGSRSCYSGGCGSSGFRSLNYGVPCFPSLSYGSRYCHPNYFASSICQPSYY
uniref:Keratin-associated protein n=1 Tax=Nannospalax galili TaxID=1026970 RepID=A0A8C6R6Z9_NANGA